jgi:uncharacterized membrane protein
MNEFVEDCRREWKRLHVPDPVANEMAADLEADLEEAAAEGASAEDVLGSGAFDPRSFAASWAAARGVTQLTAESERQPARRATPRWRLPVLAALAGAAFVGLVLLVGAALVHVGTSRAVAAPIMRRAPFPPFQIRPAGRTTVHVSSSHVVFGALGAIGLLVLLVVIIGLIVTLLFWRPWHDARRSA